MDSTKARPKGSHEGEKNQTARCFIMCNHWCRDPDLPSKPDLEKYFFCWAMYYLDYYDYGVLQKAGMSSLPILRVFVSPSFFSTLLHFLSCPDLLFQIGFPFHNCETKPYAPHTQNRNQRKKAKDSGENPGPKHSWESRIPIVFFCFGLWFRSFFSLVLRFLEHIPSYLGGPMVPEFVFESSIVWHGLLNQWCLN